MATTEPEITKSFIETKYSNNPSFFEFETIPFDNLSELSVYVQCLGDINKKDTFDTTVLYWAVKRSALSAVKFLVENGADINVINAYGSILLEAVNSKSQELVDYLLNSGGNPSMVSQGHLTPLQLAARLGHQGIYTSLHNHGAKLCQTTRENHGFYTARHYAIDAAMVATIDSLEILGGELANKITAPTFLSKSTLFKSISSQVTEKDQDTYCGFESGFLLNKRF